jgi:hypothetical protein
MLAIVVTSEVICQSCVVIVIDIFTLILRFLFGSVRVDDAGRSRVQLVINSRNSKRLRISDGRIEVQESAENGMIAVFGHFT